MLQQVAQVLPRELRVVGTSLASWSNKPPWSPSRSSRSNDHGTCVCSPLRSSGRSHEDGERVLHALVLELRLLVVVLLRVAGAFVQFAQVEGACEQGPQVVPLVGRATAGRGSLIFARSLKRSSLSVLTTEGSIRVRKVRPPSGASVTGQRRPCPVRTRCPHR